LNLLIIGVLLWLAAAGLYFVSSPTALTVVYIASGRVKGLPSVTSEGTINYTTTQQNQDPTVARWVYVKLPTELSKGKSGQLIVTFAPKRRKTEDQEDEARVFLEFNADEEEPEILVQVLAPNFNVDPTSKKTTVKLSKTREVSASFRISPSSDIIAGKAEIDILAFYKGQKVGEFTRQITIKDHSVDHLTSRQVATITLVCAVGGFILLLLQVLFRNL